MAASAAGASAFGASAAGAVAAGALASAFGASGAGAAAGAVVEVEMASEILKHLFRRFQRLGWRGARALACAPSDAVAKAKAVKAMGNRNIRELLETRECSERTRVGAG